MLSELVKFLLVNTGYESIQRLESQVAELMASKKESDRALKEATTTAKSSTNKLDEFKNNTLPWKSVSKS